MFREDRSNLGALPVPVGDVLLRGLLYTKQQREEHTMEYTKYKQITHHHPPYSSHFCGSGRDGTQVFL